MLYCNGSYNLWLTFTSVPVRDVRRIETRTPITANKIMLFIEVKAKTISKFYINALKISHEKTGT